MDDNQEKLVTVLEDLEELTRKQVSLKFTLLKGAIYGIGTVIGATVLIAILSTLIVWVFGEDASLEELMRGIRGI